MLKPLRAYDCTVCTRSTQAIADISDSLSVISGPRLSMRHKHLLVAYIVAACAMQITALVSSPLGALLLSCLPPCFHLCLLVHMVVLRPG